jgi:predicted transcriptional regulator
MTGVRSNATASEGGHVGGTHPGYSQTQLAQATSMTQPAIARFEAGGTVPTLPVLQRLAHALDADLTIHVTPHTHVV